MNYSILVKFDKKSFLKFFQRVLDQRNGLFCLEFSLIAGESTFKQGVHACAYGAKAETAAVMVSMFVHGWMMRCYVGLTLVCFRFACLA